MQDLGVKDDSLAETTKETMLANMSNDIKAYEKALDRAVKDKDNYEIQLVVDKKMWDILRQEDSIRRIEPMFVYEQNPEWTKLQHQKQLFKIRMDEATAEQAIAQYDDQIQNVTEALASAKERFAKFSEEE